MQIHNAAITGSFTYNGIDISDITGSEQSVTSLNEFSSSILNYTSSNNTNISALNAQSASFLAYTASNDAKITSLNTFSSSILSYTSSANTKFAGLDVASGSAITRLDSLEVASGSAITRISALETASGSAITRLSSIENKTGSYATTGSNIFVDGQYLSSSFNPTGFSTTASLYTDGGLRVTRDAYISGTLYLNNVTVYGTQSIAYISSSQLNIGTNLITVNTDTPSIRFGGLAVYDSGSTGLTGSILWDSEDNQWIYSNPSGSEYDSAVFLVGPRNVGTLGGEAGISCNFLSKGNGLHHMTSSGIFEDGSRTCFYGTSFISSSGAVCFAGSLTGSSAIFSSTLSATNLSAEGSPALGGIVSLRQDATYLPRGNGYSSIASSPSVFEFYGYTGASTYKNFTLRFDGLTNNTRREYTLPDACGTLALLSGTQAFTGTVCAPAFIGGDICVTGTSCIGGDAYIYGDLRMQGTDSFIWSPAGCSTGFTGFYDAFNNQVSLVVCNNSGHLLLQPTRCNVGVGVANPGQKLEVAGVIHSYDRTNGVINGAFYASKGNGTTSVIINSCGNTYFNGGNVGINTDTPITKLQICTTSTSENVLTISNGTQQLQLGVNNGANGSYLFEKNKGLRFGTCDIERLFIADTGIACFACQVCLSNQLVVQGGGNSIFAWSDCLNTQPGLRALYCSGGGINGVYAKVYAPDISATVFGQNIGCKAILATEGECNNGLLFGTINNAPVYIGSNNQNRLQIAASGISTFSCQICAPSGIKFSGGSTLSAYETSTWTPLISNLSSSPTVSYSYQEGTYTRIGNMMYVFFDITVSSLSGGSGPGIICNLPAMVSNTMAGYSVGQYRDATLVAPATNSNLKGFVNRGTTYIYLQYDYTGASGYGSNPNAVGFNSSGRITGYAIYQT
jgi:hypothetical protein